MYNNKYIGILSIVLCWRYRFKCFICKKKVRRWSVSIKWKTRPSLRLHTPLKGYRDSFFHFLIPSQIPVSLSKDFIRHSLIQGKGAVIVIFDKIQTKIIKIHHFIDNILNRNTIWKEKGVGTQGLNPGRLDKSLPL